MFLCLLSLLSTSYAQNPQNGLKGRVINDINRPVKNAEVRVVKANKVGYTDSLGNFFIELPQSYVLPTELVPVAKSITFKKGIITFSLANNVKKIEIDVFNKQGQRISRTVKYGFKSGDYSLNIMQEVPSSAMYFVRVNIDGKCGVFNMITFKKGENSIFNNDVNVERLISGKSYMAASVSDTIKVTKNYYKPASVYINTYSGTLQDIVLQSEGLPPVTNNICRNGPCKTTRYWDCCKPHCGWHSDMKLCDINGKEMQGARNQQSGCTNNGVVFQCWDYAPIEINGKVSFGWAAFNDSVARCGDCFQLDFQGALQGRQMIVQVINIGDGGANAFDLLIPGGGVGALNGCSTQWKTNNLGERYGGFHLYCVKNKPNTPLKDCIYDMCKSAFGDKPDLMRGCEWYINWFQMADNPPAIAAKVPCPKEIKEISRIGN